MSQNVSSNRNLLSIGFIILVVVLAIFSYTQYNRLVKLDTEVDAQWAQVQNVLQRRADLIPNLVNTVQGFAGQEQSVYGDIAQARSRLLSARTPEEVNAAAPTFESALGRLLVLTENYPELRSSQLFTQLLDELAGTENRIAVERQRYNEKVRDYNLAARRLPVAWVVPALGLDRQKAFFEAREGSEQPPTVDFNTQPRR
ncbi:MAG: LemA family protein [Deinococcus sp.]|nr:LemA family protein [Deinococcus sp.]